jgi:hypothetical protein
MQEITKSQGRCDASKVQIDGTMPFVICSEYGARSRRLMGRWMMTGISTKTVLTVAILAGFSTGALAQAAAPAPWELKQDMGYAYGKDGKTLAYKMGTNNAGLLLKGAKKVPKGTLFFIGQNGQLYMRSGPYLEGDGRFMFGSE